MKVNVKLTSSCIDPTLLAANCAHSSKPKVFNVLFDSTMYASLVAARMALDEDQLLQQARVESEDDQREYLYLLEDFDRGLMAGDGDCQYAALVSVAQRH